MLPEKHNTKKCHESYYKYHEKLNLYPRKYSSQILDKEENVHHCITIISYTDIHYQDHDFINLREQHTKAILVIARYTNIKINLNVKG